MMSKDDKDRPEEMNVEEAKAAGRPRKLDKTVQASIGARLRAYYDGVESEAIPDRFVDLLKQLETKDPGGDKGS